MKAMSVSYRNGEIPEEWSVTFLKDVALVNEKTIDKKYPHSEIEYIDIASVDKGRVLETRRLFRSGAPSRAQRIVRDNDILLSTVRPNLKHFAFMKTANSNTIASTGFAVISSKTIDPRFLYYYLTTDKYTDYLSAIADAHTSTYPAFNPDILENSEILYPPKNEQQGIARILSDLDAKIELNHQMNKTLEQIAQVIFKQWFVDFKFPGYEKTEFLNGLPNGWQIEKLGNLIDTVSITHKLKKDKIIFLNTSDILNGEVLHQDYSEVSTLPGQAKKSIKIHDILYSEIRPENKRFAYIDFDANDYVVSTKLMVLRAKGQVHPLVSYYFLKSEETINELQMLAESRSGTFPQITFDNIRNLKIVLPDMGILDLYTKILKANFIKIRQNSREIHCLTQMRDSLLPKLMSGKIRVKL